MMVFKAEKIRVKLNQKLEEWIEHRKKYEELWEDWMAGKMGVNQFKRAEARLEERSRILGQELGIEAKDGVMLNELMERIRGEKEFGHV